MMIEMKIYTHQKYSYMYHIITSNVMHYILIYYICNKLLNHIDLILTYNDYSSTKNWDFSC